MIRWLPEDYISRRRGRIRKTRGYKHLASPRRLERFGPFTAAVHSFTDSPIVKECTLSSSILCAARSIHNPGTRSTPLSLPVAFSATDSCGTLHRQHVRFSFISQIVFLIQLSSARADVTPLTSTAIYHQHEPGCPLDVSTTTSTPADLV